MRRQRHAKIVATLGPASSSPEMIRKLVEAGVDVFRLNFSHGSHDDHRGRYDMIRDIEKQVGRTVGILLDLQGPKLRVGTFGSGPVDLNIGDSIRMDLDKAPGDRNRVNLPHPEILSVLEPGAELLIDDGKVRLQVERCGPDFAETKVVVGGKISDRKGVNVPGVVLPLSPITEKDRKDLEFGLELGVDWIALSFVQTPKDLEELRGLVQGRAGVLSKLEKPAAIERLEGIVELSDAIMVARGDLGVELPPEHVPGVQKRIVRLCRQKGKPVIVATQMLESMIKTPTPTRAEASDVATAVYDGADAVMLSGETAAGDYPVEAVTIMNKIIERTEKDAHYRMIMDAAHPTPEAESTTADAIAAALRSVTRTLDVAAVVNYTSSGFTTLRAARERPEAPILSLTPNQATARRMALVWGVHPVLSKEIDRVRDMVEQACSIAVEQGFANPGQPLAITAGMPFGHSGTTNLLRIAWIGEPTE